MGLHSFDIHLWCNGCKAMIFKVEDVLPGPGDYQRVSRLMSQHQLAAHESQGRLDHPWSGKGAD